MYNFIFGDFNYPFDFDVNFSPRRQKYGEVEIFTPAITPEKARDLRRLQNLKQQSIEVEFEEIRNDIRG